tara:strand:- start:711 stop:962 length:252 start_codon:yes stop_codon:yes gene_type:complete
MNLAKTKVVRMIAKVFGEVLREIRTEKKVSQEKLAEYCELDRTYISLLERGLRQPSITTLFKLSKALECNPSDMVEMVNNRLK